LFLPFNSTSDFIKIKEEKLLGRRGI